MIKKPTSFQLAFVYIVHMYDSCFTKNKKAVEFLKELSIQTPMHPAMWYFCWSAVNFWLNLFYDFQDHIFTYCFLSDVLNRCLFFRVMLMWKKRRKSKLVLMSKNYIHNRYFNFVTGFLCSNTICDQGLHCFKSVCEL